jgi:hypothetical protein
MPARAPAGDWNLERWRADASEGEPSRPTPHRGGDKGQKWGLWGCLDFRKAASCRVQWHHGIPSIPPPSRGTLLGQRIRPHHNPAGAASDLRPARTRQHDAGPEDRSDTVVNTSRDQSFAGCAFCFLTMPLYFGIRTIQYNAPMDSALKSDQKNEQKRNTWKPCRSSIPSQPAQHLFASSPRVWTIPASLLDEPR